MAKGNIGNLLQHFVAITVAEQLVNAWDDTETPIEYVDCFSMSPWEPIDKAMADFNACLSAIESGFGNDVVSAAFRSAMLDRYGDEVPDIRKGFDYPNSAALLRYAFPDQSWSMRLHDVDGDKRVKLEQWLELNSGHVRGSVNGAWHESPEVHRKAPRDRPTVVMLDPNVILVTRPPQEEPGFNLSAQQVLSIAGNSRLNLIAVDDDACPKVILAFSYSESAPAATDNAVRQRFETRGFDILRVTTQDVSRGNRVTHQGWAIYRGLPTLNTMPFRIHGTSGEKTGSLPMRKTGSELTSH